MAVGSYELVPKAVKGSSVVKTDLHKNPENPDRFSSHGHVKPGTGLVATPIHATIQSTKG